MTAATLTLTDFLLARIADDEHLARMVTEAGGLRIPFNLVPLGAFDPARVLAECAAKRAIVALSLNEDYGATHAAYGGCGDDCEYKALDWAVANVATVYADHPDYRDEWRP